MGEPTNDNPRDPASRDNPKQRLSRRQFGKVAGAIGLAMPAIGKLPMGGNAAGVARLARQDNDADLAAAAESGMLRAPEAEPTTGGTLRTAFGVTTTSFDIHQGGAPAVLTHLYNGLVRFNPLDGLETIIPDVATNWEVSDDGLTYTFSIREGVTFHDGESLTADDVVATYQRIIFPPDDVLSVMKGWFRAVEAVEAPDPQTVRFLLTEPQFDLLEALASPTNAIYSKTTIEDSSLDLRSNIPPGTGPFVFDDYQEGERWLFSRNENYWNPELPYLDGLELIHVAAWSDRGTAVLTGQADLSWNVSQETWVEGERSEDVEVARVPSVGAYTVIINTEREPLNDPRVRRALHLALNRQALIEAFRTQENIALSRWVSHASPFALPPEAIAELPAYRADKSEDIETAKELLAEAGYTDGISGLELLTASVPPHAEIMAPAVQDLLRRTLNVEVELRVTERAQLLEEESNGQFDLVLDTPTISISDFSATGNLYFQSDASQNFGAYSNPEFDDLLHQADLELDEEKRVAILRQIENVLDQDPPWLLIGWSFHLPMWRTPVKGHSIDKRTRSVWGRLDTVWLDQ